MYNYPIFKHLIQFSNKVDANGHLINDGSDAPKGNSFRSVPVDIGQI